MAQRNAGRLGYHRRQIGKHVEIRHPSICRFAATKLSDASMAGAAIFICCEGMVYRRCAAGYSFAIILLAQLMPFALV